MENTAIQTAFNQVQILINDFEASINHYLSASYQEAEVRKEYIDKFYTALGWDVNHDYQKNPFEQEVKIEKAQRQQGALGQKRADYAFFLAPNYKQVQFFVEAKKPSRTLLQNKDDYFQTAKYGWNANTKVSILTDFEELVIIDCRNPPDFDTILQTKLKYYKYTDFRDYDIFEELYWIFSKEALLAGNLPKYIDSLPKPKGGGRQMKMFGNQHLSIDESFLNYIDQKRLELAVAFYKNNPTLDEYELTEATQRTIDRIVFIKFLEDKLIETEAIIHNIATHSHPWAKFVEYTKYLDGKYNGVVFKPLFIDDKTFGGADADSFRNLCSDLDHTNSPYDFNYIPIHILGSIYERFLGKIISLTPNPSPKERGAASLTVNSKSIKTQNNHSSAPSPLGRAGEEFLVGIDYKPEVRKAGGVFYTPKYIVDYIVENTVGKILTPNPSPKERGAATQTDKNKTIKTQNTHSSAPSPLGRVGEGLSPSEIAKLTFADIACGSGSFLIGVFEYLLDYHNKYYNNNPDQAKKDGCKYNEDLGLWVLSIQQKQQILLNNIYGVDIDMQATEVTQLSLFLKMLEDETTSSTNDMQVLFHEKILPNLSNNIKCGNSLIGTDILSTKLDLDLHQERKLNPFDFKMAFPKVFGKANFGKVSNFAKVVENGGFDAIVGNPPYEIIFGKTKKERNLAELMQSEYLLKNYKTIEGELNLFKLFTERVSSFINTNGMVGLIMPTNILNDKSTAKLRKHIIDTYLGFQIIEFPEKAKVFANVTQAVCIYIFSNEIGYYFKSNILNSTELKNIDFLKLKINEKNLKFPLFKNQNEVDLFYKLENFNKFKDNKIINFSEGEIHLTKYNDCLLDEFIDDNTCFMLRGDALFKYCYTINSKKQNYISKICLDNFSKSPKLEHYKLKRLAYQQVVNMQKTERLNFCLVDNVYLGNTCGYLYLNNNDNINYYLGLLNSKILNWRYKLTSSNNHILTNELYELPIPILTADNQETHDSIVVLVTQMLAAKTQQQTAVTERDKTYLAEKCKNLDSQINELVYQLYGLTDEEIAIVNGGL